MLKIFLYHLQITPDQCFALLYIILYICMYVCMLPSVTTWSSDLIFIESSHEALLTRLYPATGGLSGTDNRNSVGNFLKCWKSATCVSWLGMEFHRREPRIETAISMHTDSFNLLLHCSSCMHAN